MPPSKNESLPSQLQMLAWKLDTILWSMTRRDFHSPCLRKIGTKLVLARKHDTTAVCTQPKLTFDPWNNLNIFRWLPDTTIHENYMLVLKSKEVTTYKPTKVMASVIFVVNKQQTLESHCCLPHQCIWKAMIIETTNINQLLDTNKKPRHWKNK